MFVSFIAGLLITGALHSVTVSHLTIQEIPTDSAMPTNRNTFIIRFSDQQYSPAMSVPVDADPQHIIDNFGLTTPRPVIFITGGASKMTKEDMDNVHELMENGIAYFAEQHNITVVDGGTEAGVMQMLGGARRKNGYKFPLVGVAPKGRVNYPGVVHKPEDAADLEDGHSHFVLVESDEWGGESQTIVNLTRAIAAEQRPMMGILINGGRIAEHDVYLATSTGERSIPMLVIAGSGRTADNVAMAFKTQQTSSAIIRAIIKGGDIRLTPLSEGVPSLLTKLDEHFGKHTVQPK